MGIISDFKQERTPIKTFIRKLKCRTLGDSPEYWAIKKYIHPCGFNLNVGCGDKPIKHTIGVDNYLLETYTDRKVKCDIKGDVLNLPFRDHSVDTVVARHIWEHLPADEFLVEMARVLKGGGHLCIVLPNWDYIGDKVYFRDPTHRWRATSTCIEIMPLTHSPWKLVQFNKLKSWHYPWSFDIVAQRQ